MPTLNKAPKRFTYKKHTDTSKAYNCTQWKNLRQYYYTLHPLCEMCLKEDKITPTTEIHHIRPISTADNDLDMKDLLLDQNNLMALCDYHHHQLHNKMREQP